MSYLKLDYSNDYFEKNKSYQKIYDQEQLIFI